MHEKTKTSFGHRNWFSLLVLSLMIVSISCSKKNATIDRVIKNYTDKAFINADWEKQQLSDPWYYRLTVVDTPPNSQVASIGSGHWLHPDTIRWEITEKYLLGLRSHAPVPGAEGELRKGVNNYRGVPVVAFAIISHFDIAKDYDYTTGEVGNVLNEDESSRSWHKRRFMRVDWSNNLIGQMDREDGSGSLEKDTLYAVGLSDLGNPKRSRFENDYIEVTTRQGVKIDNFSSSEAFQSDTASPIVDVRMSFMKKAISDYQPLPYPDNVTLNKNNSKNVYDQNHFAVKVPIWEKFGFYRAAFEGQQTWDQQRGSLESNKNYNITRFNIWKNTFTETINADGMKVKTLIPLEKREPKPIIYYTNVYHPESLMNASRKVESEWNQVFKEMVYYAQPGKYKNVSAVPDMWILYENSCNYANVKTVLRTLPSETVATVLTTANGQIDKIEERIKEANSPTNDAAFSIRHEQENQAKADLERICSALEAYTQGQEKPFTYEREGDLRYNLLNLITKRALTQWSGLGPMFADSLSGEIIQATANVNLWYIDKMAAAASDQIELMLGEIKLDDIVYGTDVEQYIASKMAQIRTESAKVPSAEALLKINKHFDNLEQSGTLLTSMSPAAAQNRLALLAHTPLEKKLFYVGNDEQNDEMLLLHSKINKTDGLNLSEGILTKISPARGQDFAQRFLEREEEIRKMAHMFADPPEFVDSLIVGTALQYKDLNKRARFDKIRESVYTAVMLHEVGHNMGLTHNMAGSSDALNYGEKFWRTESLPKDLDLALSQSTDVKQKEILSKCIENKNLAQKSVGSLGSAYVMTTQDCLRQTEVMYSSIMDYHASWNSDVGGLGAYDKAAIKFGYAQLAEVFPKRNLKVSTGNDKLSDWLFLNDWRKIPTELFSKTDNIFERQHVKYKWDKTTTTFVAPDNEVPYRFCLDSSGAYGINCKAFDFGPDMRTRAERNNTLYWQHYFLTHFARGRLWNYDLNVKSVINKDLSIMADYNHIMQWYYFNRATVKNFVGSDAEKDYLAATVMGLNHFVRVLGHPLPGEHASVPAYLTDSVENSTASADRTAATAVLLPYGKVDSCVRLNVVDSFLGVPIAAKPGHFFTNVPLGDGRPFFMGLNHDYEEHHVNYVGSLISKLSAAYFLAKPGASFPKTDKLTDPRFYNVSWYRLFPDEVSQIFYDLITDNVSHMGPVVSVDGKMSQRSVLDPETLAAPDYAGYGHILPTMSSLMPYRAMFYASALLSGNLGSEMDMIKMMRVSLMGSEDDLAIYDKLEKNDIATFVHPIQGYNYRALKVGKTPVAYEMVKNLNTLKEKYLRLENCINDESVRLSDNFCDCIQTKMVTAQGQTICCHPGNPDCPGIGLMKVGKGNCSMHDLTMRRTEIAEQMENMVSFLDDMRWFVKKFSAMP